MPWQRFTFSDTADTKWYRRSCMLGRSFWRVYWTVQQRNFGHDMTVFRDKVNKVSSVVGDYLVSAKHYDCILTPWPLVTVSEKRFSLTHIDPIGRLMRSDLVSIIIRTWLRFVRVFAIANPSVVCNFCAPYSGGWNFRQYFDAILYLSHPLTSM